MSDIQAHNQSTANLKQMYEYIDLCTTRKDQVNELVQYLIDNGYDTAPASTSASKHNSFCGGLLEHSLGVTKTLIALKDTLLSAITDESCVIVGLFHDAHKVCDMFGNKYYLENKLKNGELSESKPYKINGNSFSLHGGTISAMIVNKYVELTPNEFQAIVYHDGQYVPENRCVQQKETTLTLLLHWADMWCASQLEKNGSDYYKIIGDKIKEGNVR